MKKLLLSFCLVCFAIFAVACEDSLSVRGATISEITAVGSTNSAVSISFALDSRLENLGVDVQLRFTKSGEVTFWEDNGEKLTFEIAESDVWYSLTNLIAIANGKEGQETFVTQKDAVGHNYLFSSKEAKTIAIRVVVGDIVENSARTGYILTETMPISDIFNLNVKASENG